VETNCGTGWGRLYTHIRGSILGGETKKIRANQESSHLDLGPREKAPSAGHATGKQTQHFGSADSSVSDHAQAWQHGDVTALLHVLPPVGLEGSHTAEGGRCHSLQTICVFSRCSFQAEWFMHYQLVNSILRSQVPQSIRQMTTIE